MLFILDDEIIQYVNSNSITESELYSIEKLLISYIEKYHLVYASPLLLKTLLECEHLSSNQKKSCSKMLNSLTKHERYLGINRRVRVFCREKKSKVVKDEGNTEYNLTLEEYGESEYNLRSLLICESYKDCIFYESTIAKINNYFGIPINFNLNFEYYPGGGNDTYLLLNQGNRNKRLCVLIADSDKKSKEGLKGLTASNILSLIQKDKDNLSISDINILEVREKENLIPPAVYQMHPNSNKDDLLHDYSIIYNEQLSRESYYYLDLKEGILFSKFKGCLETDRIVRNIFKCKDYTKFKSVNKYINILDNEVTDTNKDIRIIEGLGTLVDEVIDYAFGEKLKNVLEEKTAIRSKLDEKEGIDRNIKELTIKIKSFEDNKFIFCDLLQKEWVKIIKSLRDFGCSPNLIS